MSTPTEIALSKALNDLRGVLYIVGEAADKRMEFYNSMPNDVKNTEEGKAVQVRAQALMDIKGDLDSAFVALTDLLDTKKQKLLDRHRKAIARIGGAQKLLELPEDEQKILKGTDKLEDLVPMLEFIAKRQMLEFIAKRQEGTT